MTTRLARCACGALSARAEGEPARVSICHCGACKRRTGTAFSWNATYDAARVETAGTFRTYERSSEGGFRERHHFCPECGVTLWYEIERRPGMISIPAGTFDGPDLRPRIEVYDGLRCSWLPDLGLGRD